MIDTPGWAEFNQHSALCLTSPVALLLPRETSMGQDFS